MYILQPPTARNRKECSRQQAVLKMKLHRDYANGVLTFAYILTQQGNLRISASILLLPPLLLQPLWFSYPLAILHCLSSLSRIYITKSQHIKAMERSYS